MKNRERKTTYSASRVSYLALREAERAKMNLFIRNMGEISFDVYDYKHSPMITSRKSNMDVVQFSGSAGTGPPTLSEQIFRSSFTKRSTGAGGMGCGPMAHLSSPTKTTPLKPASTSG